MQLKIIHEYSSCTVEGKQGDAAGEWVAQFSADSEALSGSAERNLTQLNSRDMSE